MNENQTQWHFVANFFFCDRLQNGSHSNFLYLIFLLNVHAKLAKLKRMFSSGKTKTFWLEAVLRDPGAFSRGETK